MRQEYDFSKAERGKFYRPVARGERPAPAIDRAKIATELKKLQRPDFVLDMRVSYGQDATGDDAAWVWVIVEKDSVSRPGAKQQLRELREQIRAVALDTAPDVWTYIRVDSPHQGT